MNSQSGKGLPESNVRASDEQPAGNRLGQQRPIAWEDDICRNAIDNEPFEILPRAIEYLGKQKRYGNTDLTDEALTKLAEKDLAPLPSISDREGYSAKSDLSYWISGLNDYLSIKQLIEQLDHNVGRMFDFGCASGRVVRHFAYQSDVDEIWCSDLNARHIRWIGEHLPISIKPIANHSLPQLPIKDEYFDLVTAFSVFTHIDTFEIAWLAELKRVTRPGGVLYVTVHNEDTWLKLREELDNENNRLITSLETVDPEIKQKLEQPMPTDKQIFRLSQIGPYRAQVFHSNSYIEKIWGRYFDIVEILPCHHVRQSVVVMRAN